MTKNDEKGAILRIAIGGLMLFGGLSAAFFYPWAYIIAVVGWLLTVFSFYAYIVIKTDPDNPRNRK